MTYVEIIKDDNLSRLERSISDFVHRRKIINVNVVPFIDYGDVNPTYLATITYEVR